MAKNNAFKLSLKKFRRDLEQVINEKALTLGEEVSKQTAYAFQRMARERLLKYSDATGESSHLVQQVADNIKVIEGTSRQLTTTHSDSSKNKNTKSGRYAGSVVNVKIDKQGLAMFLEYGTGLEGKSHPHPEAEKFGWKYAINDGTMKEIKFEVNGVSRVRKVKWYTNIGKKKGFVFTKKMDSYTTNKDIEFHNYSQPYVVVNPKKPKKDGTMRQPYLRINPYADAVESDKTYVISSGIKPVRYIYNTKQRIRNILQNSKSISEVMKRLNKI